MAGTNPLDEPIARTKTMGEAKGKRDDLKRRMEARGLCLRLLVGQIPRKQRTPNENWGVYFDGFEDES